MNRIERLLSKLIDLSVTFGGNVPCPGTAGITKVSLCPGRAGITEWSLSLTGFGGGKASNITGGVDGWYSFAKLVANRAGLRIERGPECGVVGTVRYALPDLKVLRYLICGAVSS